MGVLGEACRGLENTGDGEEFAKGGSDDEGGADVMRVNNVGAHGLN